MQEAVMNDNARGARLDEAGIMEVLRVGDEMEPAGIQGILATARKLKGRNDTKAAEVAATENEELLDALFRTAEWLKGAIRDRGPVLFAPIFHFTTRRNECLFRAVRSSIKKVARRVSERMLEQVKSGRRDVFC
jgi:hypothetical protein